VAEGASLRPRPPTAAARVDLPYALPRAPAPTTAATARVVGWWVEGETDPHCSSTGESREGQTARLTGR
jgi:hypothetical protein